MRGGTTCSTCANRSSASARRRPVAACVSTRARPRARWPSAMPPSPIAIGAIRTAVHELDAVPRTRRFERSAPERRGALLSARDARRARAARARRHAADAHAVRGARAALPGAVAPADGGDHRAHRRRAVAAAAGPDRPPPPARRPAERVGARPDRLALWAVVLGFFLIFVAVTSTSHAATRAHSAGAASASGRPPAGRSHSHGDAARYPPGALNNRSGRPMRGRSGRVAARLRGCAARSPAARGAPPRSAIRRARIANCPRDASDERARAYLV